MLNKQQFDSIVISELYEGKSICVGLTSIILGIMGHQVRIIYEDK